MNSTAPSVVAGSVSAGAAASRAVGLDIYRSLAILCVLFCHLIQTEMAPGVAQGRWVDCLAVYGVELFFVLSGFLIGSILLRDLEKKGGNRATLWHFWVRRWLRTLPNFYCYLALNLLLQRKLLLGALTKLSYFVFLQNFAWPMPPLFVVSWSLSVEEWFYLLFPLVLFGAAWSFPPSRRAAGLAIATFLGLGLAARLFLLQGLDPLLGAGRMIVVYRLDAIGLGVLLAWLRRYHLPTWQRLRSAAVAGAGALLVVGMVVTICEFQERRFVAGRDGWSHTIALLLVDLSCALLLPWFSALVRVPRWLAGPADCISRLSYSLYLSNTTAMILLGGLRAKIGLGQWPGWLDALLVTVATFGLALLTYHFIEQYFLRLRDQYFGAEPPPRFVPSAKD